MKVKLLNNEAIAPKRATIGSAGYDMFSCCDITISPSETKLISLGIQVEFSSDFYLRLAPRSSMDKKGINLLAGVVDSDYRGELKVMLVNNTSEHYHIKKGDRICQGILTRIHTPDIEIVEYLSYSDRGQGGFGSTGI